MEKQNTPEATLQQQPLCYFAVTGRIPGDDESSTFFFQAKSPEEARQFFEEEIWANEYDQEAAQDSVFNAHGQIVFVDAILVSSSPIIEC